MVHGNLLRLAEDLTLPLSAITETFVIFAKRGAGKTHTAAVMVEEFVQAGLPVCAIDPVGVFWGLRSAADGQGPGLPVVILGGEHADLPLPAESGTLVADLVVDERLPVVLDLSLLSKHAQRRLVADFLERLYRRNRDALHVVIDEADLFAPQRGGPDTTRILGAYEDLVRRGRARGLGCTSITQRPATLHKDITTQSEILIALRMTGVRDVAAIDEWVRLHAEEDEAREVKATLASLPVGTAWVWSPSWLNLLRRVQIRPRTTFDSSATPTPGQRTQIPTGFAAVDLEHLRGRLAAIGTDLPGSGANDPTADTDIAALHAELARLRRELATARATTPKVEYIEVLPAHLAELIAQLHTTSAELHDQARHLAVAPSVTAPTTPEPERADQISPGAPSLAGTPIRSAPGQPVTRPPAADPPLPLKAGARRMLTVLARHHPLKLSRAQVATLAQLKVSSGTFSTYFSTLRRAELIDEHDGLVQPTTAGLAAAGLPVDAAPIGRDELREMWRGTLKAGARTMLDELLAAYPQTLTREQLAAAAGLEVSGGTFSTYLSTLRRNHLVTNAGKHVRADEVFFLDPTG